MCAVLFLRDARIAATSFLVGRMLTVEALVFSLETKGGGGGTVIDIQVQVPQLAVDRAVGNDRVD